ncbi:MAG: M20 family metallopeptidase, partial [Bacteroidota bacterium]
MEEKIIQKIKDLAEAQFEETRAIRRHMHAYPELSFNEVKTGEFISETLSKYDIPHGTGWAEHGVLAQIKGTKEGPSRVIALRADIDALPIKEANEITYKSRNKGVMHACGHDAHTASAIGAARILNALKDEFSGTIKIIFQPGEEKLPGGASLLIKEGILKNPEPISIVGQHVHPPLEVGKVGIKSGMYMASADEIYVTVKGKGGHGALPQDCIDPILITSHLITSLQQIVSRRANPTTPTVLTFGKIESVGGATNIIPDEVKLQGTFRTMDEEWRAEAHAILIKAAEGLCQSMGASCEFNIMKGYPYLINDESLTNKIQKAMVQYMGQENVV